MAYSSGMTADELRAWMDEHGRSVRDLAVELGVYPSTVQRWRDGTRAIPSMLEVALRALPARELTTGVDT